MSFITSAEKLAKSGFKITDKEIALARRLDDATADILKGSEKLSPTTRKTLLESYQVFINAAPEGTGKFQAARQYMNSARQAFPEGEAGDAAFKKFRTALSEEVRRAEGLDAKAKGPTPEAPKAEAPKGASTAPPKRFNLESADPSALAAAESVIRNSLVDMRIVQQTNGKMPKETFFGELQNALSTRGLLADRLERETIKNPKNIYEKISRREPITEQELGTLGVYFSKFHNDPKLANNAAPAATPIINNTRSGAAQLIDSVIRRTPTLEGNRTAPTLAQNHFWNTGESSFLLNRVSSYQEKPVRTFASHLGLALSVWAGASTVGSYRNYEEPSYLGREILSIATPDKHKGVSDFAEFVHSRYTANTEKANEDLKKYYGIEKFSDETANDTVSALLRGPKPTPPNRMPTPDVQQGLILFVSQSLYGHEVASTEELKDLQNKQIIKRAETAAANINESEQAARKAEPMKEPLSIYKSSDAPAPTGESYERKTLTVTRGISGAQMKERITELKEMGIVDEDTSSKLESAFKMATKGNVSEAQKLTKNNVAKPEEVRDFANAAMEICLKKGNTPEVAATVVNHMVLSP